MSRVRDKAALGHLRTLLNGGSLGAIGDGPLLRRFATGSGDEAELAFSVLVERHGATVLRVCRSILSDPHSAEDAFQATFLVLVRKAGTLRVRDSVGPWLVGVAYRVASSVRWASARRKDVERGAIGRDPQPLIDPQREELNQAVRDEVDRLPELYRRPILLCYLGGLTHNGAARQLGCPVGTVRSRLAAGRERLRDRLIRRGLAPAGAAFFWVSDSLRAAPSARLVASTTRAALDLSAGGKLAMASGVILMTKLKWIAATLVASGVVATGGMVLGQQGAGTAESAYALKKARLQAIAGKPLTPGLPGALVTAPRAERRAGELETLLLAARKQEELGNHERALELTGQMEEALRGWRTRLRKQAAKAPSPAIERKEMLTKQDVERAAVPFPDVQKVDIEAFLQWQALSERRRQRYGQKTGLPAPDLRMKAIEAQLHKSTTLKIARAAPLVAVLKLIKMKTESEEQDLPSGIPIYVDPVGLQDAGVTLNSPVTLDVEGVPLKDALRLVLDQLGLTYHVKDGLMTITQADPPKPLRR
jgi:RNA polymerase sigma factor (sigma-70 family)